VSGGGLTFHPVGGPADNLGIVRLEAAPLSQSLWTTLSWPWLQTTTGETRTVECSLYSTAGRPGAAARLGGARRAEVGAVHGPGGSWVEARWRATRTPSPLDDRASLVLPIAPLRVLYAAQGDRFLDAAIRAHPRLEIQRISPDRLLRLDCALAGADVAVVDGPAPATRLPHTRTGVRRSAAGPEAPCGFLSWSGSGATPPARVGPWRGAGSRRRGCCREARAP